MARVWKRMPLGAQKGLSILGMFIWPFKFVSYQQMSIKMKVGNDVSPIKRADSLLFPKKDGILRQTTAICNERRLSEPSLYREWSWSTVNDHERPQTTTNNRKRPWTTVNDRKRLWTTSSEMVNLRYREQLLIHRRSRSFVVVCGCLRSFTVKRPTAKPSYYPKSGENVSLPKFTKICSWKNVSSQRVKPGAYIGISSKYNACFSMLLRKKCVP